MQKAVDAAEKTELQMTSMIDVVFLLLIFFICNMDFKEKEGLLRAFLPKEAPGEAKASEEKKDKEDLQDITITLEKGSDNRPVIVVGQVQLPTFRQLRYKLGRLHRTLPDHRVVIDSKGDVPYGHVVQTLNACIQAKYTNVSFASPPES